MEPLLYEVSGKTHADVGEQLGELFGSRLRKKLAEMRHPEWERDVARAMKYLPETKKYFPRYIEELEAYARASNVPWEDVWTVSLELGTDADRCTALVANQGRLVGHVEDFEPSTVNDVVLLKRTVGDTTVLELNYFYSLGGNAASINSHGWIQLINSLHPTMRVHGIPRNVICRWLSETQDPTKDVARLKRLPRMDGYSHTFIGKKAGEVYSLESSPSQVSFARVGTPFVHTNHYLSELSRQETYCSASSSYRFEVASRRLQPVMTTDAMKRLMADRTHGPDNSIFNRDTNARIIFDRDLHCIHVWFARLRSTRYRRFDLPFGM